MAATLHSHRPYSRPERLSDAVVHLLGLGLALPAVPVLVVMTIRSGATPALILGALIYGVTLILMLTFSALYNLIGDPRWTGLLKRLDHAGIYIKIAGTYTPFTLLAGRQALGLLTGLWVAALIGLALKMAAPYRLRWLSLMLYLAMGWAALFAGGPVLAELPRTALILIATGGSLYTAGIAFLLMERMPFHNTVWHVFVLAGSVLFFVAVLLSIASRPAGGVAGL